MAHFWPHKVDAWIGEDGEWHLHGDAASKEVFKKHARAAARKYGERHLVQDGDTRWRDGGWAAVCYWLDVLRRGLPDAPAYYNIRDDRPGSTWGVIRDVAGASVDFSEQFGGDPVWPLPARQIAVPLETDEPPTNAAASPSPDRRRRREVTADDFEDLIGGKDAVAKETAAKALGCSPRTIRNYLKAGKLAKTGNGLITTDSIRGLKKPVGEDIRSNYVPPSLPRRIGR